MPLLCYDKQGGEKYMNHEHTLGPVVYGMNGCEIDFSTQYRLCTDVNCDHKIEV